MRISTLDAGRTAVSTLVGVATGGFFGTAASIVLNKDASPAAKLLSLAGAAAATAFYLHSMGPWGGIMLLDGWLYNAMAGCVAAWAIAPTGVVQGLLQSERSQTIADRYRSRF